MLKRIEDKVVVFREDIRRTRGERVGNFCGNACGKIALGDGT